MRNVTKLKIWPELQALGFVRINFYGPGRKLVAVGAALQSSHIGINNKPFKSDIICIEPHNYKDGRAYHITGTIKTPFQDTMYRIDGIGRKETVYYMKDHMNNHFTARQILETVQLMLK